MNAIQFLDHVIDTFPFRIHTVRTDRGHEFQAQFHWHLADRGIRHVYIKPRTPRLNGKVERSHRTDKQEFYQLLTYTGDVDLNAKLAEWSASTTTNVITEPFRAKPLTKRSARSSGELQSQCPTRSYRSQARRRRFA